tara:strand:- start:64 stop:219 length:156 start_codon:yes stop_codon:yes gene_type:complete
METKNYIFDKVVVVKNSKLKELAKRLKTVSKEIARIVWLIEQSVERKDRYG